MQILKIKITGLIIFLLMLASVSSAYAQVPFRTPETTANIGNLAPAITATVSDGGSSLSSPVNVGSDVTFTVTAKDFNGNQYYLAVCKTNAITAGNDAPPTCATDQTWKISSATNSESQATANYTVETGLAGNYIWYAFVCDKITDGLCFPATGSGDQGVALGGITFNPADLHGVPADGATLTIDGKVYEFDTANNGVTEGNIEVDTGTATVASDSATALVAVDAGGVTGSHMIVRSNVVYIYANAKGVGGNSIAIAEADDTNNDIALSGANLSGGDDNNASPFYVNQIGAFGTVTVTDYGTEYLTEDTDIEPGESMTFTLPEAQIDDDGTINMYICPAGTDHFDYTANECKDGSNVTLTMICSDTAVDPDTEDAVCTGGASLITVPTAHGSYNFKVYVEDNFNTPATGTNTQSYSVADVAPTLSSYTATDAPEPAAGGSDTVDFSAVILDNNGDNDVTAVEGVFFDDTAVDNNCTADENDCYIHSSCTLNAIYGNSTELEANCQVTVWFNANASANWEVHVNPTDGIGKATGFSDSNVNLENQSLLAIDIVEAQIAYGTLSLGETSTRTKTEIQNMGNRSLDMLIDGDTMCTDYPTCAGDTLNFIQQKWYHTDTDFNWGATPTGPGPYTLVDVASGTDDETGCLNRDIDVRTAHDSASTNESIWWKLQIPISQKTATYTGQNTFSGAASTTCTAGQLY